MTTANAYPDDVEALNRSLLAKWVGHGASLMQPLVDALRRHVMTATKLHADDTPVPVLAPGNGRTKTGRLWVYVRDDRYSAGMTPPAVWFAYTADRKGIHPQQHLESFSGTLQADAYGGYQAIYETGRVANAIGCVGAIARGARRVRRGLCAGRTRRTRHG